RAAPSSASRATTATPARTRASTTPTARPIRRRARVTTAPSTPPSGTGRAATASAPGDVVRRVTVGSVVIPRSAGVLSSSMVALGMLVACSPAPASAPAAPEPPSPIAEPPPDDPADGVRYLTDAAFRRAELEASLVDPSDGYARLRL